MKYSGHRCVSEFVCCIFSQMNVSGYPVKERHGLFKHRRIIEIPVTLGTQVMGETGFDDHDLPLPPGLIARQNPGFRDPSKPDTVHALNIRPSGGIFKPLRNKSLQGSYEDCRGNSFLQFFWNWKGLVHVQSPDFQKPKCYIRTSELQSSTDGRDHSGLSTT